MKKHRHHIMQLPAALCLILLFCCTGAMCHAQSTPQQSLLALSKNDHTLAIVDPASLKVLARIPVGNDPHEVIASTDGKTAYVTIYGGGSLHELNMIDLVAQKPIKNIDTRPLFGPHGIVFADNKVWFTAEGSKAIGRYDPAGDLLDWSMGTGQDRTHMIYVSADLKKIYTANIASGTVSIITDSLVQPGKSAPPNAKPHHEWMQTVVSSARGSEGFDVSPDGKEIWTASGESGVISVIDLTSQKKVASIEAKAQGANRLKFTPDGRMAFISSLQQGDVIVYDTKSRKEIKRISIGHGAAGILMDPNVARVFIACTADNYVAIIDLKKLEVMGKLDVGGGPDGLAWATRQ